MQSYSRYNLIFFVALFSTVLALGGALAHLYELPNKIDLAREQYFIVQSIYLGWNRLAYVLLFELASIAALLIMSREQPPVFWPVAFALLFLIGSQVLFWVYTYPANVATENWTVIPDNWQILRRHWEYSHAAGAVCQLLVVSGLIVAALARART